MAGAHLRRETCGAEEDEGDVVEKRDDTPVVLVAVARLAVSMHDDHDVAATSTTTSFVTGKRCIAEGRVAKVCVRCWERKAV